MNETETLQDHTHVDSSDTLSTIFGHIRLCSWKSGSLVSCCPIFHDGKNTRRSTRHGLEPPRGGEGNKY